MGGISSLRWSGLARRLARELDADWFIHLDADELRLPPPGRGTLAEALAAVDELGFNAPDLVSHALENLDRG